MLRSLLVIGLATSCVTGAIGQERPAGVVAGPLITEALPPNQVTYEIEIKILEGKGLIADDQRGGAKQLAVPKRGDVPTITADLRSNTQPAPVPTPLAQPQPEPIKVRAAQDQALTADARIRWPATSEVGDAEFLRSVYLDLLGRVPLAEETSAFLKDEDQHKRDKLIELIKRSLLTIGGDASKLPGVTVLANPKVATVANRPATLRLGSEQTFSYLEPLGNGKFELKRSPVHELGLTITLELQPVAGDDRFVELSRFEIQVSALDGREPVEGIEDLDVGRPIVSKRSLQTSAKIRLGDTRLIAIPSGPKTQAVVLVRVNPLAPRLK